MRRPTPDQEAKLAALQERSRKAALEFARLAAELGLSDDEIAERLREIEKRTLKKGQGRKDAAD